MKDFVNEKDISVFNTVVSFKVLVVYVLMSDSGFLISNSFKAYLFVDSPVTKPPVENTPWLLGHGCIPFGQMVSVRC